RSAYDGPKSGHLNLAKSGHYNLATTIRFGDNLYYVKLRSRIRAMLDAIQTAFSNALLRPAAS
ncbi:hypothetical protein QYH69_32500, partial [Paraburkholderia sp. SARCC-3016]|uniref:hypothetical protein n=1 Tax=Paraburkholderia sp. SARCC-3016 TaxID=3058611 RepID=UPI002806E113